MSEYCTCATSFDGSCQLHDRIDALTAENAALRKANELSALCAKEARDAIEAERALIVARAENAEAALVEAEREYQDARTVRKQLEARLDHAEHRQAFWERQCDDRERWLKEREAELTAADALLRDASDTASMYFGPGLRDRIDAHLARKQPPFKPEGDSLLIEMTTRLPDADMQGWNLMERTETYSQWWRKQP